MSKDKKVYIVIQFHENGTVYDYYHPILPRIGEGIVFEGKTGIVNSIVHISQKTFLETSIRCYKIN